ncbi:MAG: hypothetical protein KC933_34350, partial [Myxococcales bacterium]|nr:hypothetical protein [Myxococcales bacterium]
MHPHRYLGGLDDRADQLERAARRDLAFPAFSRSTLDRDPGDGGGNGNQPWDPESGFAGDIATPG